MDDLDVDVPVGQTIYPPHNTHEMEFYDYIDMPYLELPTSLLPFTIFQVVLIWTYMLQTPTPTTPHPEPTNYV